MISKPGKAAEDPKSYRPISLLPIIAKLMESLFLTRLMPVIEEGKLIPKHQFGFRREHNTIDQAHRLVAKIHQSFEEKGTALKFSWISPKLSTRYGTTDCYTKLTRTSLPITINS